MTSEFRNHSIEDLRLVLLRALADEPGYIGGEAVLQQVATSFGHNRSRDVIREELRLLADIGGVTLKETAGYLIATLTLKGSEHVQGRVTLEGVAKPSPKA